MSDFKALTSAELSNDEYHDPESWCAEYVSGSSLSEIFSGSPAGWKFSQKQKSAALVFGTQSHTNFESRELFLKTYRRAPAAEEIKNAITSQAALATKLKSFGLTGTSGKAYPELLKIMSDCQDDIKDELNVMWIIDMIAESQARADGVELVKAEDYDACLAMRKVLEQIPEHDACMNSPTAQKELSLFGVINGVKVKVRLDHVDVCKNVRTWQQDQSGQWQVIEHPEAVVITDYKTTSSANPNEFPRLAFNQGYYLKMSLQRDLFRKVYDEKRPIVVRLLAQEKKEPFLPLAYQLNDAQLRIGRIQYMSVINTYRSCVETNVWPSYANGEPEIMMETPAFVLKQYEDALK